MATIYEEIEDGLVGMLARDEWFLHQGPTPPAGKNNVKTINVGMPETDAPVVEFTDYFPEDKLPAVVVLSLMENANVRQETLSESRYDVPVKVLGVISGLRKAPVRRAALVMAANIERVMKLGQKSAGAPEITDANGCFLKPASSTVDVKKNPNNLRYYGLVETDVTVVVVMQ